MFLEYREGGFAVTEVAVVITEGETRGELSQVAFADRFTTQRAETLSSETPPVHQDEFHMRLLLRSWLRTTSAFEAVMSCPRRANCAQVSVARTSDRGD